MTLVLVDITMEGGRGLGTRSWTRKQEKKGRNISNITKTKPRIAALEGVDAPEYAEE